jgi:hypothetical protein
MEVNSQRSHWKTYLAIAGIIILLISLVYTSYLAERLREGERNKALLLFDAYQTINDQSDPESANLEADVTLPAQHHSNANKDIPIIVVDRCMARCSMPRILALTILTLSMTFLRGETNLGLKTKGPEPTQYH